VSGALGTSGEIADILGAELVGQADVPLRTLDTLGDAVEGTLSFARSEAHLKAWGDSGASALIVSRSVYAGHADAMGTDRPLLVVDDADLAIVTLLERLDTKPEAEPSVHELALIDPTAQIDKSASIGPFVRIGANTRIGARVRISAGCKVGDGVSIGERSELRENVVLYDNTEIGEHCTLHAGVVLGADGFGYRPSADGRSFVKIPHIGNVVIAEHVEIGANTTIDRGKFGSTRIGAGTKIDNLVMVGHNTVIGRSCIICGSCAVAGSVTIGNGVTLAGGAGVTDNVTIGDGAVICAKAGVMNNVPAGMRVLGMPARELNKHLKNLATLNRLSDIYRKLKPLLKDAT